MHHVIRTYERSPRPIRKKKSYGLEHCTDLPCVERRRHPVPNRHPPQSQPWFLPHSATFTPARRISELQRPQVDLKVNLVYSPPGRCLDLVL
ncbi:hypothetical protein PoB_006190300 [Plakobranchus ocellatus]|uniref:Uncharacterized protein n=1 Tax=Plakobranchus ocellatus TaxID=259542 RepID=A0AAV4CTZ5_9GAST|nr:hypothetical protein PoB_006190300 [Plakobranchus ocellatus]